MAEINYEENAHRYIVNLSTIEDIKPYGQGKFWIVCAAALLVLCGIVGWSLWLYKVVLLVVLIFRMAIILK